MTWQWGGESKHGQALVRPYFRSLVIWVFIDSIPIWDTWHIVRLIKGMGDGVPDF